MQNGHIRLTPPQLHYLQRVLRLGTGDRFIAMDGDGHAWLASLSAIHTLEPQAEILESIAHSTELPIRVTLVAALPKGNGFDEVVRQATELGVEQILPVLSDRTLLHPSPQKLERWQRIANEAAEQSERLCVPRIATPVPFVEHLQPEQQSATRVKKYLCAARGKAPHLLECLQSDCLSLAGATPSLTSITIAIGPEGGWTDAEVEQAIAASYQPVSLGSRVLRAVTAPLVALSLIAAVYEMGVGIGKR
ncbi:MAG: 16S rRNA (uracil(1498)-N(3))-methyltransferase [Stenomitos rutilans HA7619-LM2]|jgi:16S rRNA (uracil1498-N3)-methyltransferase|nr:16S rRNA (uracil(1498)-N(3))-methyltransferase [Stenomitos rutilans HA7619-LM2]